MGSSVTVSGNTPSTGECCECCCDDNPNMHLLFRQHVYVYLYPFSSEENPTRSVSWGPNEFLCSVGGDPLGYGLGWQYDSPYCEDNGLGELIVVGGIWTWVGDCGGGMCSCEPGSTMWGGPCYPDSAKFGDLSGCTNCNEGAPDFGTIEIPFWLEICSF